MAEMKSLQTPKLCGRDPDMFMLLFVDGKSEPIKPFGSWLR
jgi:hypothetical protein